MKSPRAALIFALIVVLLPTGRAQDFPETEKSTDFPETEQSAEMEVESTEEDTTIINTITTVTIEMPFENMNSTLFEEEDKQLEFILMVLIPVILLALLLLSVVLIVIKYKRKKAKQVPSSQGSQSALQTYELGSDNLKVPIFEEDTPSVMEIEMEELDKWMNSMNRNADSECLPTLKEEKESNHNPSDNES